MNNEDFVDYDHHEPDNATNPEQVVNNAEKPEVTNEGANVAQNESAQVGAGEEKNWIKIQQQHDKTE